MTELKSRKIKLTQETIKHYRDWVYAKGKEREERYGKEDAAAFAMGACVFYFAFGIQDQIPASLVLGPMLGGNIFIFDEDKELEAAKEDRIEVIDVAEKGATQSNMAARKKKPSKRKKR